MDQARRGIPPLTRFEARFVEAVERAQTFVPAGQELAAGAAIRGEVLRAILLGTEVRWPGIAPWKKRAVKLTRYGIRIGVADESKPGPAIRITGSFDTMIELSGARIYALRMLGCRFSRLNANGTHFDESVHIIACGPLNQDSFGDYGAYEFKGEPGPEVTEFSEVPVESAAREAALPGPRYESGAPPGRFRVKERSEGYRIGDWSPSCEVSLRGAAIGVGLVIRESSLRASTLEQASKPRSMRNACALELSHAHVRDRVELVRSTFIGGARFVGIAVGDDVWIYGGKFVSYADRYALDFQFARIVGQLGVKGHTVRTEGAETFFPVVVIGQFSAVGVSAGEVWIAGSVFHGIENDRHSLSPAINFSKANIAGTFKLGLYHPHYGKQGEPWRDRVYIHGEVSLIASTIGKNMEVHGARPGNTNTMLLPKAECSYGDYFRGDRPEPFFSIRAEALKVDRRVAMTGSRFIARPARKEERASGSSPWPSASSAIDLFKSTVGTGLKIKRNCACTGAVRINSCVIGREVVISCNITKGRSWAVEDSGALPVVLDLRETSINGQLRIGHVPAGPSLDREASEHKDETCFKIEGGISLESARVEGVTILGYIEFHLHEYAARGESESSRVALNLRDFRCASDLEVRAMRWALPPLSDSERKALEVSRWFGPRLSGLQYADVTAASYAVIDLRSFRCGLLKDSHGADWGLIYGIKLLVGAIRVNEVETGDPHASWQRELWLRSRNSKQRVSNHLQEAEVLETSITTSWQSNLFYFVRNPKILLREMARFIKNDIRPPAEVQVRLQAPANRVTGAARKRPQGSGRPVDLLKRFWDRLYCSRPSDFAPQAFDAFSIASIRAGDSRTADHLRVQRIDVENALRVHRYADKFWRSTFRRMNAYLPWAVWASAIALTVMIGVSPWLVSSLDIGATLLGLAAAAAVLVALWPLVLGSLQLIFRYGFRYGLSPLRALVVLLLCIGAGSVVVDYLRFGTLGKFDGWKYQTKEGKAVLPEEIVLVMEVPHAPVQVPDLANTEKAGVKNPMVHLDERHGASSRWETRAAYAAPAPCNLDVNSILYAVDVFIPVLDLEQESRCTIRHVEDKVGIGRAHDPHLEWRVAKAIYELLGWIITSLVVLTVTGILRRAIEGRFSAEDAPGGE